LIRFIAFFRLVVPAPPIPDIAATTAANAYLVGIAGHIPFPLPECVACLWRVAETAHRLKLAFALAPGTDARLVDAVPEPSPLVVRTIGRRIADALWQITRRVALATPILAFQNAFTILTSQVRTAGLIVLPDPSGIAPLAPVRSIRRASLRTFYASRHEALNAEDPIATCNHQREEQPGEAHEVQHA
jgi:hypothetical protein